MLEKFFLNHGHCAISWGENTVSEAGLLWVRWWEATPLQWGVLTLLPSHVANATPNAFLCWKDFRRKAESTWQDALDGRPSGTPVELKVVLILPLLSNLESQGTKEATLTKVKKKINYSISCKIWCFSSKCWGENPHVLLWSRRKILMEYRDLRTEVNKEKRESCYWWRWKLLMVSILNNHQNNCNISRVTSAWYRPPNIKQLRQHIGIKQILPSGGQNSPAAFPQLPLLGGSKAAFINPTS